MAVAADSHRDFLTHEHDLRARFRASCALRVAFISYVDIIHPFFRLVKTVT